jgi:glycosyltransferase involved in cell wall biosynthesis
MADNDPRTSVEGDWRSTGMNVVTPLVSVVIVVFRDRDEVQRIVDSIVPFKTEDLEIVVIDGGSKDGTVELLKKLGKTVDYWLSEPDSGIYDAMNKGLRAARGTYILHLNAGDRLCGIPWDALSQAMSDSVDVVCCQVLLGSEIVFDSQTDYRSRLDNTWHHQGTFYRREAHLGYDTSYRILGDCEHNHRLLKSGCSMQVVPFLVADHDMQGVSTTTPGKTELYRSIRTHFGEVYVMLSRLRFFLLRVRAAYRLHFGNGVR